MNVLILGNGISRLPFKDQILAYPGEVWACNNAFLEFPEKITRLTGHVEPMEEAERLKKENGYSYEIYAGVFGKADGRKRFTVATKWLRDSGSTMAAQALHEGYNIELCGFDMGGADIHSPNHWQLDKRSWVRRWADIIREWGADRVTFWGYNHKPYLLRVMDGRERPDKYYRFYHTNRPHLIDSGYRKVHGEIFVEEKKRNFEIVIVEYPNGHRARYSSNLAEKMINKGQVKEIERIRPEVKEPIKIVVDVPEETKEEAPKKRGRKKNESM